MDPNSTSSPIEATISQYLADRLEPEKVAEMEAWIAQAPQNKALFEEMKAVWEKTERTSEAGVFDAVEAWKKVAPKLSTAAVASIKPFYQKNWFQAAAAILVLLAVGYLWGNKGTSAPAQQLIAQTQTEQKEVILEDGTTVLLNEGSTLSYPETFASTERKVALEGEAFFSVEHDGKRPFTIETNRGRVTVLGTSFSVRAYKEDQTEEVYVKTGKVMFTQDKSHKVSVILIPGEKGSSDVLERGITRVKTHSDYALAWRDKKLVFKDTPLEEVILTAGRFFGIELVLQQKEMQYIPYSGTFLPGKQQEFFESLGNILGLKIKKENGKFVLM